MNKLTKRLSELMEKVVRGEWGYCYDGSSDWSIGLKDDPQEDNTCSIWCRDDDMAIGNCQLIVETINALPKLLEIIRIQGEALENITTYYAHDAYGNKMTTSESRIAEKAIKKIKRIGDE